tara:strand:- start:1162 stop:2493 length:1332 start_codon:yes stop_codon:yes gene_type:complete
LNKKIEKVSGTIAALATARGAAGIAVTRVSGPRANEIFRKITKKTPEHMIAKHTTFYGEGETRIDSGIALFFKGPDSYTGEDVVEFSSHGSSAVIEMLLERVYSLGGREAEPGEFTRRAYLNDKMDLTQAEAVADLIQSVSARTAAAASRSLVGEFSDRVNDISAAVSEVRALVETTLDFSDQDLEDTKHPTNLLQKTEEAKNSLETLIKQTRTGIRLRNGMVMAIVGKPNVGKSSLFNRICGSERAIVSSEAGTTRDIISENITIDGFPLRILDTAGVRDSQNQIEQEGVKRAIEASESADIVLEVIDSRDWNQKNKEGKSTLILNKADLLTKNIKTEANKAFLLSAKTGEGVDKLLDHIAGFFMDENTCGSLVTARKRHLKSINEAYRAFCSAQKGIKEGVALDLVAQELVEAQNSLAEVTGEFTTEDLLEEIFKSFCIGK